MTPEQETLKEIREAISQLPEDGQIRVKVISMSLQNMLAVDEPHAMLAIALVGAELAARD